MNMVVACNGHQLVARVQHTDTSFFFPYLTKNQLFVVRVGILFLGFFCQIRKRNIRVCGMRPPSGRMGVVTSMAVSFPYFQFEFWEYGRYTIFIFKKKFKFISVYKYSYISKFLPRFILTILHIYIPIVFI